MTYPMACLNMMLLLWDSLIRLQGAALQQVSVNQQRIFSGAQSDKAQGLILGQAHRGGLALGQITVSSQA